MIKTLQFLAILCTAVSMAAGWAHLFELPHKMALSHEEYLIAQQLYRGWALIGIVVVAALGLTAWLSMLLRGTGRVFYLTLAAALCIALGLAVFFAFTFPANQATQNWTVLPAGWEALRRQWEYSHAAGAILNLLALAALALSVIVDRR